MAHNKLSLSRRRKDGSSVFDASHYAFFGNHVVEEVELGGLEDEEEDFPLAGIKKRYINKIEQNNSGFTLSSTKAKLSSVQKNFRKHLCSFRKAFQKIGCCLMFIKILGSIYVVSGKPFRNSDAENVTQVEVGSSNPRWSTRIGSSWDVQGRPRGSSNPRWVIRAGRPTRAGSSWVVRAGRPTRAGLPASASVVQPSSPTRVREPAVVYPSSTRVDMPLNEWIKSCKFIRYQQDINKMEDSDFGWTGLDKEDDTHVTKEKSRYRYDGMLDTETMTNPTDKTVVHLLKHLKETKENGSSVFDASHYAFFGNHVVEEVELGGLEDEEEDFPLAGIGEDFAFDKEEVIIIYLFHVFLVDRALDLCGITYDLPCLVLRLYQIGNSPLYHLSFFPDYFLDGRNHGEELTNLYGQQILDSNDTRWISQPFSTPDLIEQRNLHRAISYPEPQHHQRPHQHQQQFSSEPIILPKSSGGDRKISM
uniref:Uncharacterized protein n=1 Tax=Brassica oleracea var. oleracea TaxID=109376 RepID=A0A0D3BY06_BRAOL